MKQSLLPLICIALIAGCGTNPKEKTSASADHMQHRIERNEVTVDTLRRKTLYDFISHTDINVEFDKLIAE